ncbi:MAG: hypothetical protein GF387_01900 [Candidatus Portnoybacteria bacterium]|nr:hypothetical protein [Candidatus Portnoybacteria bacterium]
MKKAIVLLTILVFLTGCTTIGQKHLQSGRSFLSQTNPVVEDMRTLKNILRENQISENVGVIVYSNNIDLEKRAKEAFFNLGFKIGQKVDYIIELEEGPIGQGNSTRRGFGYSNYRNKSTEVRMTVEKLNGGGTRHYSGTAEYSVRSYYYGYYSTESFQAWVDLSLQMALINAIGDFIQGENIF